MVELRSGIDEPALLLFGPVLIKQTNCKESKKKSGTVVAKFADVTSRSSFSMLLPFLGTLQLENPLQLN